MQPLSIYLYIFCRILKDFGVYEYLLDHNSKEIKTINGNIY